MVRTLLTVLFLCWPVFADQTAIYFNANGVIKRLTKDQSPQYDVTSESPYTVADNFSLANGPWKFDNPGGGSFNKVQATQQEAQDAMEDQNLKALKSALQAFHASAVAYKAARNPNTITNLAAYLPLFDDILRDLDNSLQQVYKTLQ